VWSTGHVAARYITYVNNKINRQGSEGEHFVILQAKTAVIMF